MVDAILTNTLLPQISQKLLTASREQLHYHSLSLSVIQGEFVANLPLSTMMKKSLTLLASNYHH